MKYLFISLLLGSLFSCQNQQQKQKSQSSESKADRVVSTNPAPTSGDSVSSKKHTSTETYADTTYSDSDTARQEVPLQIPFTKTTYRQSELVKEIEWQTLETGLHYAEIPLPIKCNVGNSKLSALRIDPTQFELLLASTKFAGHNGRKADEWADSLGLIAVVNAGMFSLDDYVTCTGYMKHYDQVNNPNMNSSYNLIAAFNPQSASGDPAYRIIDRRCENWDTWKNRYNSYVQGIRIIDCNQVNRWSKQEKFWSMVLLGEDLDGNMLFLFTRSPYRVHDLSKMILKLPIRIAKLMYLEGGPEASLYISHPRLKVAKMGSYETGFNPRDNNQQFWSIPNIIGIKKK